MSGHQEQPDECDSCGWETTDLREVDCYARTQGHGPFTPDDEKEWDWLCEVCHLSMAGRAYQFPRSYDNAPLFGAVAWGINRVIAEIRAKGEG